MSALSWLVTGGDGDLGKIDLVLFLWGLPVWWGRWVGKS